jgi:hypothetical protein
MFPDSIVAARDKLYPGRAIERIIFQTKTKAGSGEGGDPKAPRRHTNDRQERSRK